ncbi:TldD/PmbA family protein [Candidatus Micrarchaeota archaeon]|nr:TldD/PmbA family protein [Candidatus Micrarchaeota archaeon]MBU1165529.1 TldD/PmbA family protein [Candidatus Micrarchaeota archaeon]MBU1886528.1 TldD/PmbA family protein [Candidatus Micrarchaeota archaeon]
MFTDKTAEHEIFFCRMNSTSLNYSGGDLKVKETDSSSGYGIRVLKDKKIGFAYCQKEGKLNSAISEAQNLSRFSVSSSFSFAGKSEFTMPDIVDKSIDPFDYDTIREYIDQARDGAESAGGKARIIASVGITELKLENTSGFSGSYQKTDSSLYTECIHGDGFGISYSASNKKPKDVYALGKKAATMAKDMQNAKKPEDGSYIVSFELETFDSVLGVLLSSFSGDWKRRGISKLKQNEKMFSEDLTIIDDGLANGTSARPFDDEGIPSKKRMLVDRGLVCSFLYDRETAALAGVADYGSCSRSSFDSHPSITSSNLCIKPGTCSDLNELDKYLEIHYAHGAHTSNPINGDIGLEVSGGFLVERGKRTPVKGFMLTGNVYDWFANIKAIEKKTQTLGDLISPKIAFNNVRVVSS